MTGIASHKPGQRLPKTGANAGAGQLSARKRAFAENVLAGMNYSAALRAAAPDIAARWKPVSITRRASQYAQCPAVQAYIAAELERRAQRRIALEEHTLTRVRKRAFLGGVVEAHASADENSPLAHLRDHDPLAAIKIDNEMTGDNAPVKVEGEVTLGVIMRALASTTGLPAAGEMAEAEAFDISSHETEARGEAAPAPAGPASITRDPAPGAPAPAPGKASNGHGHGNGHANGHARKRTY